MLGPELMFYSLCNYISPLTTQIFSLSLHDALPIFVAEFDLSATNYYSNSRDRQFFAALMQRVSTHPEIEAVSGARWEEHTSELQSPCNIVCSLVVEKKNSYKKF